MIRREDDGLAWALRAGEKLCQGREGDDRNPKERPVNSGMCLDAKLGGSPIRAQCRGCGLLKTHRTPGVESPPRALMSPMEMALSVGREGQSLLLPHWPAAGLQKRKLRLP